MSLEKNAVDLSNQIKRQQIQINPNTLPPKLEQGMAVQHELDFIECITRFHQEWKSMYPKTQISMLKHFYMMGRKDQSQVIQESVPNTGVLTTEEMLINLANKDDCLVFQTEVGKVHVLQMDEGFDIAKLVTNEQLVFDGRLFLKTHDSRKVFHAEIKEMLNDAYLQRLVKRFQEADVDTMGIRLNTWFKAAGLTSDTLDAMKADVDSDQYKPTIPAYEGEDKVNGEKLTVMGKGATVENISGVDGNGPVSEIDLPHDALNRPEYRGGALHSVKDMDSVTIRDPKHTTGHEDIVALAAQNLLVSHVIAQPEPVAERANVWISGDDWNTIQVEDAEDNEEEMLELSTAEEATVSSILGLDVKLSQAVIDLKEFAAKYPNEVVLNTGIGTNGVIQVDALIAAAGIGTFSITAFSDTDMFYLLSDAGFNTKTALNLDKALEMLKVSMYRKVQLSA